MADGDGGAQGRADEAAADRVAAEGVEAAARETVALLDRDPAAPVPTEFATHRDGEADAGGSDRLTECISGGAGRQVVQARGERFARFTDLSRVMRADQ
ncbi:MAG: hypothetical protein ACLQUT_02635 [Thermoleophilia bacterium]